MKTIAYIVGALVAYKMLTGKQLIVIPTPGTVVSQSPVAGATAPSNSVAPEVSGGRGTLTGVNAPADGAAIWYQPNAADPASPSAAFITARPDGSDASSGVFLVM